MRGASKANREAALGALADGLVVIVRRDCPTCSLLEPLFRDLAGGDTRFTIYTQDDPDFPRGVPGVVDDRGLEISYGLGIEIVPTLIRMETGAETGRIMGWNREEWRAFTGLEGLGQDLPENRPGCGARNIEPGLAEELAVRFGDSGLTSERLAFDAAADIMEICFERGWTDGLPVTPPTEVRVLRMLQGTVRDPAEVLGTMAPDYADCSVEKVAINAVMAGCKAEYLPVVLAAVEAVLDPAFGLHLVLGTTTFVGPMIIVNGPIARDIGMNSGGNVLGQGNRANGAIGRALQLCIRNVGGGRPGEIDRSTLGHPGKYTFCIAEDEAGSCWESLAEEKGFPAGVNVVTVLPAGGVQPVIDEVSRTPDDLALTFAQCLRAVYHPGIVEQEDGVVIMAEEHERPFRQAGWSKQRVKDAINAHLQVPLKELVCEVDGMAGRYRMKMESGVALTEKRTFSAEEVERASLPKFFADKLTIVRAGAKAGLFSAIIPGLQAHALHPISKEIQA